VPYFDAFPTAGSLVASVLLARKLIQNWLLWILVNTVSIALFACKDLTLTAVLYAILIVIAVAGYTQWRKLLEKA
jgi:nicotinamide mononucleotide transporter